MKIEFESRRRVIVTLDSHRILMLSLTGRVRMRRRWVACPLFGWHNARRVRTMPVGGQRLAQGVVDVRRRQQLLRLWAPFVFVLLASNEEDVLTVGDALAPPYLQ